MMNETTNSPNGRPEEKAATGQYVSGDRMINVLIGLILTGVVLRALARLFPVEDPYRWSVLALLALFSAFLALSFLPGAFQRINPHLYFGAQSFLVVALLVPPPHLDFYAVSFGILGVQTMGIFSRGTAFRWIGAFAVMTTVVLIWELGWLEGLPLVVLYITLYFALAYFVVLKDQAQGAQRESQRLLDELRKAHEQLQKHAAEIEELAVMRERNRLARDLHDSVTQSLYSLTLFTQAARDRAAEGDLPGAEHSLARIADTAWQSLKEMRLLVHELRPLALEERDLVKALRARLDQVERRAGVQTRLVVEGEGDLDLPDAIEDELYHIGQEALNNALKHAHASAVTIRISRPTGSQRLEFEVKDDGQGFDMAALGDSGGLGLLSMRERVENMNSELVVQSAPGQGTTVRVIVEIQP